MSTDGEMINISQDRKGKVNVTPVGNINQIQEVELEKFLGYPLKEGVPFYAFVDQEAKPISEKAAFRRDDNGEVMNGLPQVLFSFFSFVEANQVCCVLLPCTVMLHICLQSILIV